MAIIACSFIGTTTGAGANPVGKFPPRLMKESDSNDEKDIKMKSLEDRFMDKVSPEPMSGCWLWTASLRGSGYGAFRFGSKVVRAHRVAYELLIGPIPEGDGYHGTCVLHTCDTRSCVNPDHLWLGTHTDNMHDRDSKGRGAKGGANGGSKLNKAQVAAIFSSTKTKTEIAAIFGISKRYVFYIKSGQRRAHLTRGIK